MKGSLVADETPSPEEIEVPEPPINADNDVDEIAAQAEKPDAVSKAIKAEREAAKEARRRAEEAEAKVKEYEDAQKSEQQKLEEAAAAAKEEADALRKQITELEVRQRRSDVALAKNLPPKLAERLRGETVEEIEADADALLEDLGTIPGETPPPGDGGARTPVQPKGLADEIAEAEAAGDYRKAMSLKNQQLLSLGRTA
jgi:chromosome segregation ATPase